MLRSSFILGSKRNIAAWGNSLRGLSTTSYRLSISNFNMPSMSPTMTEGNVSRWNIKEGDSFNAGDVLLEIETDKAQIEVEAPEDGILAKILVKPEDGKVAVGSPIAILAEEGDDITNLEIPQVEAVKSEPKQEDVTKVETNTPKKESIIQTINSKTSSHRSPAVSHLLSNYDIKDPSQISSTGPKGLLTKGDVLNYIKEHNIARIKLSSKVEESTLKAENKAGSTFAPISSTATYTDIPTSNMRRVIASRLLEAKSAIPHAYTSKQIVATQLNSLRSKLIDNGIKVSINDFIVKACALALRDVPQLNVRYDQTKEDNIQYVDEIDISVAVATPTGLFTPIVKMASAKGIKAISDEIKDLATRAKANKLKPNEYQGGSFSISNLGMFGIKSFKAIINSPAPCILAVSGTTETVLPKGTVDQSSSILDDLIAPSLAPSKSAEVPIPTPSPTKTRSTTSDILTELIEASTSQASNPHPDLQVVKTLEITLSSDARIISQDHSAEFLNRVAYYLEEPERLLL